MRERLLTDEQKMFRRAPRDAGGLAFGGGTPQILRKADCGGTAEKPVREDPDEGGRKV